mgnify:CR=1 FL=1
MRAAGGVRDVPAAGGLRPARRPLRSFEELRAIGVANEYFFDEQGRPTPLYDAFTSMVSLYAFGDTNINTAEDGLLLALGLEAVQRQLEGKAPRKVIVVPGKIVNIVMT